MTDITILKSKIEEYFPQTQNIKKANGEVTVEVLPEDLRKLCFVLRDHDDLKFEQLIDVAGVDYLDYGISQWVTNKATGSGFERAVDQSGQQRIINWDKPRLAVAYHFLSVTLNHRVRVKVFVTGEPPLIPSIVDIWPSANWYEREAFDLYGILFDGHPDLRRILTDYGFTGHPFRKDFPLSGNVEVRYDAALQRVIYEPVDIVPRILVPKVIRLDENAADNNEEVLNV